ncbi:TIM44-like domain-containing protein [Magnetospirillum sp. UT-4]|uniref:Tim44 domain-containing protein n=1 Tax=Magnetospirillum sp. UT-4 TaxID=2681467 RepID=UPI0020C582B0|nr:TIM44-like domain-containing protein [Magnetospirillum sp. UT-4]
MRLISAVLAVVVCFAMAADAWAKAGRGSSMGSRGSRTYDRPIERSITPPASPSMTNPAAPGAQPMYNPGAVRQNPAMAPAAPMGAAAQPGFFQRNPMMAGIMGGLVGAGIGSMLFGHSPALAAASDASPMASMFGTLLQLALVGGLIYLGFRLFRRRPAAAPAGGAVPYHREAAAPVGGADVQRVAKEFEPSAADQEAFSHIIAGVQKAWSDGNPVALRNFATPEVVGWMGEDQARDQSNGVRNVVEEVELLKGDVTETWRDGDLEYATAIITFSAKDYMVRIADGTVVEGDATRPVETTEAWTFVRSPGGTWLLSAIEQV